MADPHATRGEQLVTDAPPAETFAEPEGDELVKGPAELDLGEFLEPCLSHNGEPVTDRFTPSRRLAQQLCAGYLSATYTVVVTAGVLTATGVAVRVRAMTAPTESVSPAPWRPRDTLAARLFLARREAGLSQREAAVRCGITYGEWQSMENGADARGLDRKLRAIADGLGVDRDWLVWGGPLADPFAPRPGGTEVSGLSTWSGRRSCSPALAA